MSKKEEEPLTGAAAKRFVELERIHTRLTEYVADAKAGSPISAGIALREQNMPMFAYYEAVIHIADDLKDILEGKHIQSMKEAQAERFKLLNENRKKEPVDPNIH